jgi:hypothetical protein
MILLTSNPERSDYQSQRWQMQAPERKYLKENKLAPPHAVESTAHDGVDCGLLAQDFGDIHERRIEALLPSYDKR